MITGQPNTGGIINGKEKPVKTNSGVSISLHIGSDQTIKSAETKTLMTEKSKPVNSVKATSVDSISEKTIELEDWMKSPKEWNNNNQF